MTQLSSFTKNGQTLSLKAGNAAIAVNDLVAVGGPGLAAYTVATADYAANAPAGAIASPTQVSAGANIGGNARQPVATDALGNIFIVAPNSNSTVYKYSPTGTALGSAVLDANLSYNVRLLMLTNGNFAAVYARAAGALYFVVFDAALNIVAGPTSVATEYASTNTVYHAACALAGGGFGIAYQSSAGTAINFATYSNAGAFVLGAISVQTLASTVALAALDLRQLSNGNLLVAMRTTMTPAGTTFVIVNTSGTNQVANTVVDGTSSFGFMHASVMASGYFAIAAANGANLKASVYNNAGALQGSQYSVANTINSTVFMQSKIVNDGVNFYLAYMGSAANGVNVVMLPTTGTGYVATTGMASGSVTTTFAIDAVLTNGVIAVLAASIGTGGQYWLSVGLPDATLGISAPYLRSAAAALGSAANATGSYFPAAVSTGDWTMIAVYDQQSTAGTFLAAQKIEASAIVGVSQSAVAIGNTGSVVRANGGPGQYPCNAIAGTPGKSFNHTSTTPVGNIGTLFQGSIAFGPAISGGAVSASSANSLASSFAGFVTLPPGSLGVFGSGNYTLFLNNGSWICPPNVTQVRARVFGGGGSGGGFNGTQTAGASSGGNQGGTSSFGTFLSATGGSGGGSEGFTASQGGAGAGPLGGAGGASGAGGGAGGGGGLGYGGTLNYQGGSGGAGGQGAGNGYYPGGGGGGGGVGSHLGPGGAGGTGYAGSTVYMGAAGGGGGLGGNPGASGAGNSSSPGGGGGSAYGPAIGSSGGMDASGTSAANGVAGTVNPYSSTLRFPGEAFPSGGGGGNAAGGKFGGAGGGYPSGAAGAFGGGGAGAFSGYGAGGGGAGSGGGGGGGGFSLGTFPVAPGQSYPVTIGAGGGQPGGMTYPGNVGGSGYCVLEW